MSSKTNNPSGMKKIKLEIKLTKKQDQRLQEDAKEHGKDLSIYVKKILIAQYEDLIESDEKKAKGCTGGWYNGHRVREEDKDLVHPKCTDCGKTLKRHHRQFSDEWSYSVYSQKKKILEIKN